MSRLAWRGLKLIVDSAGAHPETVTVSSVGTAARTATTLAAASLVGDTNIKVTSVTNMVAGEPITVDTGGNQETGTIQSVGTSGAGGTGVTLVNPLTLAHANGAAAQDIGTGVTFSPALAFAHASNVTAHHPQHVELPARGLVLARNDDLHRGRPRRQDRHHDGSGHMDGGDVEHDEHAERGHVPQHVVLHGGRPERNGRHLERHDLDGDHR